MQSLTSEEHRRFGFDERFEDRWWRIEVGGWCVMTICVIAGLLGGFGRGPLTRVTMQAGTVTVEYERVVRYQTPTRISVSVAGGAASRVFIGRSLLDRIQLQTAEPPPLGSEPRTDGAVLLFSGTQSGQRITLVAQAAAVGLIAHAISVDGAGPVSFTQLALP